MQIAMVMKFTHSLKILLLVDPLQFEDISRGQSELKYSIQLMEIMSHTGVRKGLHLVLKPFSQFLV